MPRPKSTQKHDDLLKAVDKVVTESQGFGIEDIDIPDEALKDCAPDGYKPNKRQCAFVKAYIISGGLARKGSLATQLQIPDGTVRGWFRSRKFRLWLRLCQMKIEAEVSIPLIYAALARNARCGDRQSAHMVLLRYDGGYRSAFNKTPEEQHIADPRLVADDAAATLALQAASPSRRTLQHKPTRIIDIDED